jgi:predicted NBD/HSP70 family sugar kinase
MVREPASHSVSGAIDGLDAVEAVEVADPLVPVVAGVDVGGTKVRAALREPGGRIVAESTVPSAPLRSDPATGIGDLVRGLVSRATVLTAVGVGLPGVVDQRRGTVSRCPAFPGLAGVDIRSRLAEEVGVPTAVDNDANAAAWGEFRLGGHGSDNLALLALGTGIGLGAVVDGRLLRGAHGAAGEVAEVPLRVDGKRQPTESVASVAGLLQARAWRDTARVRELIADAERGDPPAVRAVEVYADAVADALLAISGLIDPGVIVFTGGLGVRGVVVRNIVRSLPANIAASITVSSLGERAPLLGALELATDLLPPAVEALSG